MDTLNHTTSSPPRLHDANTDLHAQLDQFVDSFDALAADPTAREQIVAFFTSLAPEQHNPLGEALRFYREQAGWTIRELARAVGVKRSYIQRLEGQKNDWRNRPRGTVVPLQPTRDLMLRIAITLKLDTDRFDDLLVTAGYAPLWSDLHLAQVRQASGR